MEVFVSIWISGLLNWPDDVLVSSEHFWQTTWFIRACFWTVDRPQIDTFAELWRSENGDWWEVGTELTNKGDLTTNYNKHGNIGPNTSVNL